MKPEFSRPLALIDRALGDPPAFVPVCESPGVLQVERAIALAHALCGKRANDVDRGGLPEAPGLRVVDHLGHARRVYRPLLACCFARQAQIEGDIARYQPGLRAWAEALALPLQSMQWPKDALAERGDALSEAAWHALALHAIGEALADKTCIEAGQSALLSAIALQAETGAYLRAGPSDNPETHWYHELLILHAVADFALISGEEAALRSASRAARYHRAETQPDHADPYHGVRPLNRPPVAAE